MKSLFLMFVLSTNANILTDKPLILYGPKNSSFGYSVAFYNRPVLDKILIGAPTLNSPATHKYVKSSGGVFVCSVSSCKELAVDMHGEEWADGKQWTNKTNQRLGATLVASENEVVVCAPNYVRILHRFTNRINEIRVRDEPSAYREAVGNCFVTTDLVHFDTLSPCFEYFDTWKGYDHFKMCLAGFSAATNRGQLYIGAPGNLGYVFSYSRDDTSTIRHKLGVDIYFGYSVAISFQMKVIGAPRAADLYGYVKVSRYRQTKEYIGGQYGSYFGYSLCIVNVDADREDDLLVGAPLYSNSDSYETGRVYVLAKGEMVKLTGQIPRSRFGTSIAKLGDINADGVEDFAVGAPYGSTVYIYYGDRNLNFKSKTITKEGTFGFSIIGGLDLDSNSCPDFVVGDYENDRALVFRTQPLVHLTYTLKLGEIDSRGSAALNLCMAYTGKFLPATLTLRLTWRLQFMNFPDGNSTNVTQNTVSRTQKCWNEKVLVKVDGKRKSLQAWINTELISHAEVPPALSDESQIFQKDFQVTELCGKKCIPDLRVSLSGPTQYMYGSLKPLVVKVVVENLGDAAFNVQNKITLSPGFILKGVKGIACDDLICDIPPLLTNTSMKFDVVLDIRPDEIDARQATVAMEVYNEESSITEQFQFNSIIDANISMRGLAFPDSDVFQSTDGTTRPVIVHRYYIENLGQSVIGNINISLEYPKYLDTAEFLIMKEVLTTENIDCPDPESDDQQHNQDFSVLKIASYVCTANRIGSAEFEFRFEMNQTNLQVFTSRSVIISTRLKVTGIKLPFETAIHGSDAHHEVLTTIIAIPKDTEHPPLWVIEVSACSATLILLGLTWILYRVGFFERLKKPTVEEQEIDEYADQMQLTSNEDDSNLKDAST